MGCGQERGGKSNTLLVSPPRAQRQGVGVGAGLGGWGSDVAAEESLRRASAYFMAVAGHDIARQNVRVRDTKE